MMQPDDPEVRELMSAWMRRAKFEPAFNRILKPHPERTWI